MELQYRISDLFPTNFVIFFLTRDLGKYRRKVFLFSENST
jgi:hypothetical protein